MPTRSIVQRLANLIPILAHSRKNNAITAHADSLQVVQFPSGHNVKTASHLGKVFQDGQIPIGLYRKTQRVRQCAKSLVQFPVGIINRSAAVCVSRRAKFLRHRFQRHPLAHYFFAAHVPRPAFGPRKMRRESRRVHVFYFAGRRITRMGHRTFATTSVRSSESGAPCVNQSTSRRIASAISAAVASWCCSISFISRVVPKNWLSLFAVSTIPSE